MRAAGRIVRDLALAEGAYAGFGLFLFRFAFAEFFLCDVGRGVDRLHKKENNDRDKKEIDDRGDQVAVSENGDACFFRIRDAEVIGVVAEDNAELREIHAFCD